MAMSIEEPKFTVSMKEGHFELRDYAARVVTEVTVNGNQRTAGTKGVHALAGYIFGGNSRTQKIAMTAPVTEMPTGGATAPPVRIAEAVGDWLVRFAMPDGLALSDLPVPDDPQVHLTQEPAARYAVLEFSGLALAGNVTSHARELLTLCDEWGLAPNGPVSLARYDPPWTPWFLRRNEVMLPVTGG